MVRKEAVIFSVLLVLTSCSLTGGSFCTLAKPHRFNDATVNVMTDAEVKQELAYNKTGQELCGWKQ
jgi:hypothetical protein